MAIRVRDSDGALIIKVDFDDSDAQKSIEKIVNQTSGLTEKQNKLLQGIGSQYKGIMSEALSAFNAIDNSTKNLHHNLASLQLQSKKLSEAQRDINQSFKTGSIGQKEYLEGSRALAVQLQAIRQRISETGAQIRQQNILERSAIGSIAEKTAKLTQLKKEYNALSEAQRNNINVGGRITAEYRNISEEVQRLNNQFAGTKAGGIGNMFDSLQSVAGKLGLAFGAMQLVDFGRDLFNIAKQAEGVQIAFDRMSTDGERDLKKLRDATKGTVSDLELMKLAVRADNFKISMDVLAKGLTFARQRANDTGQSVDYLVNSFVDGLGRQSKLVLDNLGISAKDLSLEIEKVGDFATAAGNIIDRSLGKDAGNSVDTLADRVDRVSARWENLKLATSNYFKSLMTDITALLTSDSWNEFMGNTAKLLTYFSPTGGALQRHNIDQMMNPYKGNGKKDGYYTSYKDLQEFRKKSLKAQEEEIKAQKEVVALRLKEYNLDNKNVKKRDEMLYQNEKLAKMYSIVGQKNAQQNKNVKDEIGLIGKLKEEIEVLEKLRNNAKNVSEINEYTAQINAKQKELDVLTGTKSKSRNDRVKKEQDALNKQIEKDNEIYNRIIEEFKDMGLKYTIEIISPEQAEINKVIEDYDAKIQKAIKHNEDTKGKKIDIAQLETEKGVAVNNTIIKQEKEKKKKENEDFIKLQKEAYDQMLELSKNSEDEIIAIRKKYQEAFVQLEKNKTNITIEEYERRKNALKKGQKEEIGEVVLPDLKENTDWINVFEKSSEKARTKVLESIELLKKSLKQHLDDGKLTIEQYNEALKDIKDVEVKVSVNERGFGRLKQILKDLKEAEKGSQKYDEAKRDLGSEISNIGGGLVNAGQEALNIADQLGFGSEKFREDMALSLDLAGNAVNLAASIASGDVMGMITNGIKTLSSAISLFTKDRGIERKIKEYQGELNSLGQSFEKLQDQINNSVGTSFYTDSNKQIENLKQQQILLQEMAKAEESKKKTDKEKVKAYNDELNAIDIQIKEIQRNINENLVQTTFKDLSNELANALVSAFEAGENAIDSMDDVFDKFIKNALVNSLKLKMIEPIINEMVGKVADYMNNNDNSLMGFDFQKWQEKLEGVSTNFTKALDEAYKGLGLETESAKSNQGELSKGIQGITETTANRLEAEFGGLRLAQLQLLELQKVMTNNSSQYIYVASEQLSELVAIQNNTLRTANNTDRLVGIEMAIVQLNSKVVDGSAIKRGAGL